MVKIDLITGFLGSGKTTFIKKYAKYLIDQGNKIAIIENDYGAINVDLMLLQDLQGPQCELEMVIGGTFEDHKRRLRTKLISMAMQGYQRVIIEPSGIFDVDEFFDLLREEPLDIWYEIGNVLAIVDASLSNQLSKESKYLLTSQLANAGIVILSKTQDTALERIQETKAIIQDSFTLFQCNRVFQEKEYLLKDWNTFVQEDFELIINSSYSLHSHIKMLINDSNDYQSLFFMNLPISLDKMDLAAKALIQSIECGNIIRIKGFIQESNQWYSINITKENYVVEKINEGQHVIIVIGENLNEEKIRAFLK